MTRIEVVRGDITTVEVDAIVNPANTLMRGSGGGVDGAIHRTGGPAVLADCKRRFPDGLEVGAAGWTEAGNLRAERIIHTVGPDYSVGQRDRALLDSCYREALRVADSLSVASVAFPIIGAGAYGWPRAGAIAAAVDTLESTQSTVSEIVIVVTDETIAEEVKARLGRRTPLRILQGVRELHRQGHRQVRVMPGMSPSGMYWRVEITASAGGVGSHAELDEENSIMYTSGSGAQFAGAMVGAASTPNEVADAIQAALPGSRHGYDDAAYAAWYDGLMTLAERYDALPIAYADFFDSRDGWTIGWGSGVCYEAPPGLPANK